MKSRSQAHVILADFNDESENLRQSWGYKEDDYCDVYLRRGKNMWDKHPCRIRSRSCIEEYLSQSFTEMPSLLEIGCGSGNEYDGLIATGLAEKLVYTGVDIAVKNIANALARYPAIDFRVGNILENLFSDDAYDIVLIKDMVSAVTFTMYHLLNGRVTQGDQSGALHRFPKKGYIHVKNSLCHY